ncbi:hypothetical protein COX27_01075 [Candidatus Kuenenbacteria bacterium CG23_combo_of_CG06-09_8_20_14_all_36_9]|uniref:DUF5667 domain-containing protein n=1 Tax=Candidatus Kuenenbacteria bacterium CG10_big_fil_rev_8_21_14_0_10_36_11 TaxID=1974618 RepID=A0A2M6WBM2_9BACT|nr:MAG: hypothetical protein COX27_01075 [Candidatus Kuenenbacteria bacterium CG23_combo_of_CG06-09_8_20_14_all_36_9]PIT90075.1 MAG: hypothetical protein COU23_00440 [Candidatus Kuenenbacteria bacterium CG10_big_fil_rev_8_21_14_0_10_36_11]
MKPEILNNLSSLADQINMTAEEKEKLENFVMGKILSELPAKEERIPVWLKLANSLVPANFVMQPAAVFSLIIGLFLITSFASVNASKNSLPGDTLYPLKLTAENLRYNLSFSSEGRAKAAMTMAENRMGELKMITEKPALSKRKKKVKIAKAAAEVKNNLNLVADKLQNIAPDVSESEAATIKEIDVKLSAVKNELNQVGVIMGDEESGEVQLAEAEAEKASAVALAVLDDNNKKNMTDNEQSETDNTSTPETIIEQKTATSTNTSSEYILPLIIEQETTTKEEFKVKLE